MVSQIGVGPLNEPVVDTPPEGWVRTIVGRGKFGVPALGHPNDDVMLVPRGLVPALQRSLPDPLRAEGIDFREFCRLERLATPAVGRARRPHTWEFTHASALSAMGYQTVPLDRLTAAQQVPSQDQQPSHLREWCCGPNSAARAARLLGDNVVNFEQVVEGCPLSVAASVPLKQWRVGPFPWQLRDHLRRKGGCFAQAQTRCTERWTDMGDVIRKSGDAGKPMIALLVWGQFAMHYVCVVGVHHGLQRVAVLDTDNRIYTMPMEELHTEMLRDVPIGGGLSRYNAIHFV